MSERTEDFAAKQQKFEDDLAANDAAEKTEIAAQADTTNQSVEVDLSQSLNPVAPVSEAAEADKATAIGIPVDSNGYPA